MPRLLKHLVVIVLVLLVCACSGGGCSSGCAGCGITPLPEGFPAAERIENGGSVRLTDSGLAFIEANLGTLAQQLTGMGTNGVITFPIDTSSGSNSGIDYEVCPGGPDPNANPPKCVAEIDIGTAQLNLETTSPRNLHVYGNMPVRLQNLPVDFTFLFIPGSVEAVLNGNDTCPGEAQTFAQIPIDVNISVEIDSDMAHSRYGYSRIKIVSLTLDQGALQDNLHFCGGLSATVLNFLKGLIFDLLVGPLLETLTGEIESALCQQANPDLTPPCPSGSTDDAGTCRYADGSCVSIVLGMDGNVDLSGALAALSPGTKGGLDFLFAAGGAGMRADGSGFSWGDLNPINSGATLGMYGGVIPQPISGCVNQVQARLPVGIPIPDELLENTIAGWPATLEGPHLGIALSERFANYALTGVYNSGLLCLGITTDSFELLSSSTLGLLIGSVKTLGLQKEAQPVALVVRPGQPPTVTFGNGTDIETDPTMRVLLNEASFDFYIWSLDRYIRFMTATFDLDVPVNLDVTPEGLAPLIKKIGVNNGKITNAELLSESEDALVSALQEIISSQVGSALGGGISPIDLNSSLASLGLTLTIPESVEGSGSAGLRKLSKGTDNFLGIFATLGTATAPMIIQSADTNVRVTAKLIAAAGLRAGTMTKENRPSFTLAFDSPQDDGSQAVEYSYRVDGGFWKPFSRERIVEVSEPSFRLQGRHSIEVRARVAGQPMSLDPTPALIEVLVDDEAPHVKIGTVVGEAGTVSLDVRDLVSGDGTFVRTRLDGGDWSAWMPASAAKAIAVVDADELEVEAKDEEGNVASVQQALIRGKLIPDASGCGCSVPGESRTPAGALALLGIALAGVLARLGRRLGAGAVAATVAGSWAGCSCGDDSKDANVGAGYTCVSPCRELDPGLVGAYTSAAVSGSTVWVAGYLEADYNNDNVYGDLVVGRLGDDGKVAWDVIDGLPDPAAAKIDGTVYDTTGFRGGQSEPGPDVGLWTSIAIDGAGNPAVAYYDRSSRALKYAAFDGTAWSVSFVEQVERADLGRYAKLVFADGTPVIAYLAMEPGEAGAATSKVRVATGPAGSWKFEDAYVDTATPCRKHLCASGTECVADTLLCTPTLSKDACNPVCASGSACVDQAGTKSCVSIFGEGKLDSYPDAAGNYVALAIDASGSLGLAFYDRIHGNVVLGSKASGSWTTQVVDGQAPDGTTDMSDVGVGLSLFIDGAGDWHLSYVDGHAEALKYLLVTQGTTVGVPEIVDSGLGLSDGPFADNQHVVGDDSKIVVSSSGEVRVTYQDATSGKLRQAIGTPSGAGHTWALSQIEQEGFAGAFSGQVEVDGKLLLMNWWRVGGERVEGDVAFVTP